MPKMVKLLSQSNIMYLDRPLGGKKTQLLTTILSLFPRNKNEVRKEPMVKYSVCATYGLCSDSTSGARPVFGTEARVFGHQCHVLTPHPHPGCGARMPAPRPPDQEAGGGWGGGGRAVRAEE